MRVFAISDIHIDFEVNRRWIENISAVDYSSDILILAGDICHNYDELQEILINISKKFKHLFFVPGNHDLWIRNEEWQNSIQKFIALQTFCRDNDIYTSAKCFSLKNGKSIWIIPLFGWYTQPGEGDDTLFIEKPGEDKSNRMWSDNYFIKWPKNFSLNKNDWFLKSNPDYNEINANDLVITFSHFLPRQDMVFRESKKIDLEKIKKFDRTPAFNFSRVAGSDKIDQYIRKLNSKIHIYGHQHINRDREIDGLRYISHCLGYPNERRRGQVRGIEQGIKLILEFI